MPLGCCCQCRCCSLIASSRRHRCRFRRFLTLFACFSSPLLVVRGNSKLRRRTTTTQHKTTPTRRCCCCCSFPGPRLNDKTNPQARAESQQIAAWKLLYRVQHPARYVSRLQTIPSPDIERRYTHGRPLGAGRRGARDPAADRAPRAANRARATAAAGGDRLIKSHFIEPFDSRNSYRYRCHL